MQTVVQTNEPERWSGRRWIYAAAGVFLLQVLTIFYLGERSQPAREQRPFRTQIFLAGDALSAQRWERSPGVTDPTLFALPSVHGFSGKAWLNFPPVRYEPTNWTERPQWLGIDTESLGQDLVRFVATNNARSLHAPPRSLSAPSGWDIYVPPQRVVTRSTLRVEQDRELLSSFELPSWSYHEILTNTVVRVTVDANGRAVSAAPLGASGFREADQFALKLASGARFKPVPRVQSGLAIDDPTQLSWVNLIFAWHTLPPASTNQAPPGAIGP